MEYPITMIGESVIFLEMNVCGGYIVCQTGSDVCNLPLIMLMLKFLFWDHINNTEKPKRNLTFKP